MNTKSLRWKLPLTACIIALALTIINPPFATVGEHAKEGKLKLGLDLQGGMHLVLRVKTEVLPEAQREDATEIALEIIRNRVDQFGVSEPKILRQGKDQIVIQLPGISDRDRALSLVGKTALLQFKLVADVTKLPADKEGIESSNLIPALDETGKPLLLENKVLLEGKNISSARSDFGGQWGDRVVLLEFDAEGAKIFGDITSQNRGRQLAIILDGVVQSAPVIQEAILSGQAQITGSFSTQEAFDLAIALKAGALPAPIEILEERTVGPELGKESIEEGMRSILYGGVAVLVFMTVYYLFSGLVANFALVLNILLIGAALAYFKGTLTMPGIAGVILTVGMAVDTNVLILERIREELRVGKSALAAINTGYKKAFSAILDSNITTLLTAGVLYYFGTGPVRGFALTLGIGIIGSFFCGIFVTRLIYDTAAVFVKYQKLPMLNLMKDTPTFPFLSIRKILFSLSCLVVVFSLFTVITKGSSSLGVDFVGGTLQEYSFSKPLSVNNMRDELTSAGYEQVIIQSFGEEGHVVVRSGLGTGEGLHAIIEKQFIDANPKRIRIETVGPVIGKELRKKALFAILGSLAIILAYLAFRFEFRYSIAAIIALFHDATVCLALVILCGREITIPVLAALLTIVGYSVNDTIVIFDRVRENVRKGGKELLVPKINRSINESLSRTLLTSLTTLFVVAALFFYGGPVINDFAFTMMVGIILGTYSTMYIAVPCVVDWPWRKQLKAHSK